MRAESSDRRVLRLPRVRQLECDRRVSFASPSQLLAGCGVVDFGGSAWGKSFWRIWLLDGRLAFDLARRGAADALLTRTMCGGVSHTGRI